MPYQNNSGNVGITKYILLYTPLGSVIVRQFLKDNEFKALGRVVMLAPPSQGSEVVDRLGGIFLYKWINGPAGLQLGTSPDSLPNRLGPVNFECGVLAGRKTINLYLSTLFTGENDGKVSVERAKFEGMKDFRVLDVAHPFIMQNPRSDATIAKFPPGRA